MNKIQDLRWILSPSTNLMLNFEKRTVVFAQKLSVTILSYGGVLSYTAVTMSLCPLLMLSAIRLGANQ